MRFYVDNNVHRLGRKLRLLGYDTAFFGEGPDDELRELYRKEGRILLTRDTDFEGEQQVFLLQSDSWREQLKHVVSAFSLDTRSRRYSLCADCNVQLRQVPTSHHNEQVPDWVVDQDAPVWRCPECEKIFWGGSHLKRMENEFSSLFSNE